MTTWMEQVFAPRSVAVYGASRQEGKLGNTLLRNVLATGYDGVVVPVNPSGGEVLGHEAVPNLAAPVDLALISVPAERAVDAVADAAKAGCAAAVVLSSGFGETGEDGRRREAALREAAAGRMRLIGPNCMGVLSRLSDGTWMNGTYFWEVPTEPGGLSFLSQSGAFGGMFFREVRERGFGLSRFVSLGNAADVTETDVLEYLVDDEATTAVGLFVEGIRDGRRFVEVARRLTERKPLVVLKAGKVGAGARAAASHTGSLAGVHGVVQAAFARAGVIEAPDSDSFFDAVARVSAHPQPVGRAVAVLTISGGPGVLAADVAEQAGLALPPPSPATLSRLKELVPDFAALGNPIDLTPQCPAEHFPAAIEAVFEDPAYDGVVVINVGLDIPSFGEGVAAAAKATGKPATAFVLDVPEITRHLDLAGIPRLASPERAVRAYAATGQEAGA